MEDPAADHLATIDWERGAWSDKKGKYSRQHLWVLKGTKLRATDSGAVVPAAYRDNTPIDPHNMFVATIASAHMLTWLHIAFGMEIEVERYVDRAYAVLTGLEGGDCWISELNDEALEPTRACARTLLRRPLDQDEGDSAQWLRDSGSCRRAKSCG